MTILLSERLRLEPIEHAHYDGLRLLNSDPEVMRYFTGRPETEEETRQMIDRVQGRWKQFGYSWWSIFERASGELIGAGCIQHLAHDPANPHEIGWRLRPDYWGRGYALEAAQRMARFAFEDLQAPSLCAICDPPNERSARVMQRLGMRYRGLETWQAWEVSVYEIERAAWERQQK